MNLGLGYNCILCGWSPVSLPGRRGGWVMLSPASQVLETLPFPAQIKGRGACFVGEGIAIRWASGSFFLQLVAIIYFIIFMAKNLVRSLPNFSTNIYGFDKDYF